MVGCQHQQIAVTQLRQHGREPDVEPFEISSVPLDVVPVTKQRIEIHQVGEYESAIELLHLPLDLIHAIGVACGMDGTCDPAAGEEILDLANRDDRQGRRFDAVEQRFTDGRQGVVAPVRCSREMARSS